MHICIKERILRVQSITSIASKEEFDNFYKKVGGLIFDIRNAEDYAKFHLPKAVNIDLMSQGFVEYFSVLNHSTNIFIYCLDGTRTKVAVRILTEMGFSHLYKFNNGIKGWDDILS